MDGGHKKMDIDIYKYIGMLKKISIDKWILIGLASLVLVLCSDSCSSTSLEDKEIKEDKDYSLYGNSANNSGNGAVSSVSVSMEDYTNTLERELEDILMSVEGIGQVKVMITLENSATKQVLMEEPYTESYVNESDSDGGTRDNREKSQDYRVIYEENGNGITSPFVITESTPDIAGVAVVAQGGDSVIVKEKITSIIKALFGVEINKIAVGKMK